MAEASTLDSPSLRLDRVGPDRVEVRGDVLQVRSVREMPDWRVSKFRRTAVHYCGSRYAVVEYRQEAADQYVYRLELWPDEQGNRWGHELTYDEAYVDAREQIHSATRTAETLAFFAAPLTPVLGLLPSFVKANLHGVIGVHPNTATKASIFLEYLIAIVCLVLGLIHLVTGASEMTAELVHVFWLAPLTLADAVMRRNCVEDEWARQYGFYEWLVRWILRRP